MAAESALFAALAWGLTFALHSTLILGGASLVARGLRSPHARERLWKTAFLGALATTTLAVWIGVPPLGGEVALRTRHVLPAEHQPARQAARAAEIPAVRPALHRVELAPGAGTLVLRSIAPGGASPASPGTPPWILALSGAWILGAGLALARWTRTWRRLETLVAARRPIERGRAAEILEDLVKRTGAPAARLSISDRLSAPITFGIRRPEICLPARALAGGLRPEELRAMLAHELAHAARRDPAWLLFCGLVERVLFFQPLLAHVRRRWQEDAELCSDDWAVRSTGESLSLAACLTEVAGWILRDPGDPHELPVPGMGARGAGLGRRVRRLLEERHAPAAERARPLRAALALAALGGVVLGAPRIAPLEQVEAPREPVHAPLAPQAVTEPIAPTALEPPSAREPGTELADPPAAPPPALVDSAAPDVAATLAALDREILLLEDEASALQIEIDHGVPDPRLSAIGRRVEDVRRRVGGLRARRERLGALLAALAEEQAGAPPAHETGSGPARAPQPPMETLKTR